MSTIKAIAVKLAEWLWAGEHLNLYGPPAPERGLREFIAWHLYAWGIS